MGKTITSPVRRFPGTVTLSDPLSYPQVYAWRDAIEAAQAAGEDAIKANGALVSGILSVVEEWHLAGVDPARFPATPAQSAAALVGWLVGEISALFAEAETVPLG